MAKNRKRNRTQPGNGYKEVKNQNERELPPESNPGAESEEIPTTGYSAEMLDSSVDEIEMSDLIDLSNVEEMENKADQVDPMDMEELMISDGGEMKKYTDDDQILEDLVDRQQLASGSEKLIDKLKEHTSEAPDLSAEDIDASWWSDNQSGEESVGGSVATPEQNITDEIGEAVGIEYSDFEPLATEEKLEERDENRWELSPESALDEDTIDEASNDNETTRKSDNADDLKEEQEYNQLMSEDDEEEDIESNPENE